MPRFVTCMHQAEMSVTPPLCSYEKRSAFCHLNEESLMSALYELCVQRKGGDKGLPSISPIVPVTVDVSCGFAFLSTLISR